MVNHEESKLKEVWNAFANAILTLNQVRAREILDQAECSVYEFFDKIVAPVMDDIGEGWSEGKVSLAQVYMCGRICEEIAQQHLKKEDVPDKKGPVIAIGVLEDHHNLGKRIVLAALRAAGYRVLDLGCGLTAEEMIACCEEAQVEILLISTLMLRSALEVSKVREALKKKGALVKILVGGAPFNMDSGLWQVVGADRMAKTTAETVAMINQLTAEKGGSA